MKNIQPQNLAEAFRKCHIPTLYDDIQKQIRLDKAKAYLEANTSLACVETYTLKDKLGEVLDKIV